MVLADRKNSLNVVSLESLLCKDEPPALEFLILDGGTDETSGLDITGAVAKTLAYLLCWGWEGPTDGYSSLCISEDFVKFGGKEEPSRVGEGFGLEVPFLLAGGGEAILSGPTVFEALHLLGFLFGRGRGRRAAHAVAVHHAGSHGLHVLLHPLHVAYQRFPHIHVVPPACHLVRILDRENVSLHLRERRLHLLHLGLHGLRLLLVHLHHLLTMLGPHLVSNAGAGRRLRELFLCPHHGRQSEYQNE